MSNFLIHKPIPLIRLSVKSNQSSKVLELLTLGPVNFESGARSYFSKLLFDHFIKLLDLDLGELEHPILLIDEINEDLRRVFAEYYVVDFLNHCLLDDLLPIEQEHGVLRDHQYPLLLADFADLKELSLEQRLVLRILKHLFFEFF